MYSRSRIARSSLPTLRTRVFKNASRFCDSNLRLLDNRTKPTEDETEKHVSRGHGVAALLVAALGVLLRVLGHADHLGDTNGIQSTECL